MPRNTISEYPGEVVYIVRCADDSYYTGRSAISVEKRVSEHNLGVYDGYTKSRKHTRCYFVGCCADRCAHQSDCRDACGCQERTDAHRVARD